MPTVDTDISKVLLNYLNLTQVLTQGTAAGPTAGAFTNSWVSFPATEGKGARLLLLLEIYPT